MFVSRVFWHTESCSNGHIFWGGSWTSGSGNLDRCCSCVIESGRAIEGEHGLRDDSKVLGLVVEDEEAQGLMLEDVSGTFEVTSVAEDDEDTSS